MNEEFRNKLAATFLDSCQQLATGQFQTPVIEMSERWFHTFYGELVIEDISGSLTRKTTIESTVKKIERMGGGLALVVGRTPGSTKDEGRVYVMRRDFVPTFVKSMTGKQLDRLPDNLADLGWVGDKGRAS